MRPEKNKGEDAQAPIAKQQTTNKQQTNNKPSENIYYFPKNTDFLNFVAKSLERSKHTQIKNIYISFSMFAILNVFYLISRINWINH